MYLQLTNCLACNEPFDFDINQDINCCSMFYRIYNPRKVILYITYNINNDKFFIGLNYDNKSLKVIKTNYVFYAPLNHLKFLIPSNIESYIENQIVFQ